jgi:hypothetical protein
MVTNNELLERLRKDKIEPDNLTPDKVRETFRRCIDRKITGGTCDGCLLNTSDYGYTVCNAPMWTLLIPDKYLKSAPWDWSKASEEAMQAVEDNAVEYFFDPLYVALNEAKELSDE